MISKKPTTISAKTGKIGCFVFVFFVVGFLLINPARADLSYTRTPEGSGTIISPVSIDISITNFKYDLGFDSSEYFNISYCSYWTLEFRRYLSENNYEYFWATEHYSAVTGSFSFLTTLEVDPRYYVSIYPVCYYEGSPIYYGTTLEYNPSGIFTIGLTSGGTGSRLFSFPSGFIASSSENATAMISDSKPALTLIIGLCLGIWIINWLVGLTYKKEKKK